MENLNLKKSPKPTLSKASVAGKKLDTNFNKQIRSTGMSIKESRILNEKEESLKKKIFKLDKMETLTHTDEYLSSIFADLKQDADELYGYHWNETILNMIFNDYVLNSPKYLQRYKNTRAMQKTRRGEEGIAQLQNDIDKEKEVASGAEERKQELLKKDAEIKSKTDSEKKLDEWNPFASKTMATPAPAIERSVNDLYFIDKKNNLVAVAPYKNQEQFRTVLAKYAGNPDIKKIAWFDAVSRGIKNVPREVTDGNYDKMKAEFDAKYKKYGGTQAIPALAETDGAESSGSFAAALDSHNPNEIADTTYQNETTTSASSGQYSGKAIWSKDGKPAANKPAWKGGVVLGESVINGDLDYMTDPSAFKQYILKCEIAQLLTEEVNMEESESFKQHAAKMMQKWQEMQKLVPDDEHVNQSHALWKKRYETGKVEDEIGTEPTTTVPTQQVAEHHLHDRESMIQFILSKSDDAGYTEEQLDGMSDEEIDSLYLATEKELGISEEPNYREMLKKDLKYTGHDVTDNESTEELESQDGLFKGKWNGNEPLKENANLSVDNLTKWASANVLYATTDPSAMIEKFVQDNGISIQSLKDKAKFYASNAQMFPNGATIKDVMLDLISAIEETSTRGVDEGIFDFGNSGGELNVDQIRSAIENFNSSQDSAEFRNQFVKAKDYIRTKAGNVARMPQLKMWLDKNMPQLSNYVGTIWGNWDLVPNNKLSENKTTMNKNEYKTIVKAMLESTGKSLKSLDDKEKKSLFENADFFYKARLTESMIDDQPDSMINNQESSITKSMDSDELNSVGASVVGGVKEASYDTDDLSKSKPSSLSKVLSKTDDYNDEVSPELEEPVSDEPTMDTIASVEKRGYETGDDPQVAADALKFKEMLKAKYGVDSVGELSNVERAELMKSMNFGGEKKAPEMNFSQFQTTDDEKAAFSGRDEKRLSYLAQHADNVTSVADFAKLASDFKNMSGENMHHPMAILASIQALPSDSALRIKLSNIENILKSNMKESVNEERKPSSLLNVEKLGKENAKNFKVDNGNEDGISSDTNYPFKKDGIYNEKVWPDPAKFYIEQDLDKVQKEAKSMADIEKEALAKTKGQALKNVGNSANEKGNEITKRNLTKGEMVALAMNRGDGMQDIVYDNKPSDKFEKRMEKDMGDDIYELRQDKMDFRASAPMYNKDTQPSSINDKKEENNKFKVGYNTESGYKNESITGKYRDEFNKFKLVEFKLSDVVIVETINENAFKLSLDGMGNKYKLIDKKINENVGFENVVHDYDFYLHENNILAIKKVEQTTEPKVYNKGKVNESSFEKMKHLMNYKPTNYVDTKKSVKY